MKPTANYMELKLIGRLPPCEVCAKAKIRQRNVQKKKIKKMPTKPGYRVFIDISSLKQVSRGGNKHWLIMVDEFSDYTHSFFLKKKSDQIKILPMWIKGIAKKHRIEIKRIRLDNSGEIKSLQKECNRSLLPSGGLMADVPCLDHSLDSCKGRPDDVQTTKHARRTHAWSRCARTSLGAHVSPFGASSARF